MMDELEAKEWRELVIWAEGILGHPIRYPTVFLRDYDHQQKTSPQESAYRPQVPPHGDGGT
jgi:hypothetical protein